MAGAATNPGQDRSAGQAERTPEPVSDVAAAIEARAAHLANEHDAIAPLTEDQIHAIARLFADTATGQHKQNPAA